MTFNPMTESIPACQNCKHFVYSPDPIFSECEKYYSEKVNYLTGEVYRSNSLCIAAREKEGCCGRSGKDFEPKPEESVTPSKKSFSLFDWFFN